MGSTITKPYRYADRSASSICSVDGNVNSSPVVPSKTLSRVSFIASGRSSRTTLLAHTLTPRSSSAAVDAAVLLTTACNTCSEAHADGDSLASVNTDKVNVKEKETVKISIQKSKNSEEVTYVESKISNVTYIESMGEITTSE